MTSTDPAEPDAVAAAWTEGARQGFPLCCRVQFCADVAIWRAFPPSFQRLWQIAPRRAISDGLVPCWYHTARWLLTGKPPMDPGARLGGSRCCDARDTMESECGTVIRVDVVEAFMDGEDEPPRMIAIPQLHIDGAEPVHCPHCPWCGKQIE